MHHIEPLPDRRLLSGVSFDTHFGAAGAAPIAFHRGTGVVDVQQLATDSRGYIYVAVVRGRGAAATFQVRRMDSGGAVDPTWAVNKNGNLTFADPDGTAVMHIDAENRLDVLAGSTLYRFEASGTPDTRFGQDGAVTLTAGPRDFTIDANDRIWLAGSTVVKSGRTTVQELAVQRLISRGKFDRTFASRGTYVLDEKAAGTLADDAVGRKIAALADGTVLVGAENDAGLSAQGGQVVFGVKFGLDGALVRTYGTHGVSKPYAGINNEDRATTSTITAIRPNGHLDIATSQRDLHTSFSGDVAAYISPTGKTAQNDVATPPDFSSSDDDSEAPVQALAAPGGSTLVVTPNGDAGDALYLLTPAGEYDTVFDAGHGIAATRAALADDGAAYTATADRDDVVTVRRYDLFTGPVATLARPIPDVTAPTTSVKFSITYTDAADLNASTITRDAITIVQPTSNRAYHPKLVGIQTLADGTVRADFRVANPDGQPFTTPATIGYYQIQLTGGTADGGTLVARTLGRFLVAV